MFRTTFFSVQCQGPNELIQQIQEMIHESKQIRVDIARVQAQLKRVNQQINKNNVDPNPPVLVEFMESALESQQTYLMRELFRQHANFVGLGALVPDDEFIASSGSTVADRAVAYDG